MEFSTQEYMKKALLDTQEQVRDFMFYAEKAKAPELKSFFRDQALNSGEAAKTLREFIQDDIC